MKDPDQQHPIAEAWRPTVRQIARALAEGDHTLSRGIPSVAPPRESTAGQMRSYLSQYGETLAAELPDQSWDTSVALWMNGYWEVLVDLWTVESGRSDLVLHLRVFEAGKGFRFELHGVYVP